MVKKMLADFIRLGGKMAPEHVFAARLAICQTCPKKGVVKVVGIEFDGCTECGCPFVTKLRSEWHALDGGKVECPEGKW